MAVATRQLVSVFDELLESAQKNMEHRGDKVRPQRSSAHDPFEMTPLGHAKFMFGDSFIPFVFPVLFRHIWLIADNQTSQPFFTSDAPVIRHPHDINPFYGTFGFGSKGVEILLPLTSRFLLILLERSWFTPILKETDGAVLHLKPEEVTYYNELQVYESYRQIYCQDDQFELARFLVERDPKICDQEYSRIAVVGYDKG